MPLLGYALQETEKLLPLFGLGIHSRGEDPGEMIG